ncbi:MAG: hydantoinase/oxoprolinase family protein [Mogibacterium sp.]|nr:hydantoinase/oxoprolinase family protein [Mogibacterium sp.]
MKIGIGIDTGGTCTDAVIYRFEDKSILATAKTPTTHGELHVGIGEALDRLPRDLVDQSEVIALSTTLATNACVENKGGRARLIFFGVTRDKVKRVASDYGLTLDDSVIFVDCKTRPSGEIVDEPDWDVFEDSVHEWLDDWDAVGVVEMYAKKTGAVHEKHARNIIEREIGIPVVCGYSLFSENNIVKRGASALLNARLIFVIDTFLKAVKKALRDRDIHAPFVIVRSDGSLMTGKFTATRPVETLLCGPVASVMGATELSDERNALVVDIGGTTTDVAFVKDGSPQRVKTGVHIGKWDTFVKGLFVDTFGLGGDSGVIVDPQTDKMVLEDSKVMPLCMAASRWPSILHLLEREEAGKSRINNQSKNIYVRLRDIEGNDYYTEREQYIASLFEEPKSLENIKSQTGELILEYHLERLIREGAIIRCGVTPTDAMHYKGDFLEYDRDASTLGLKILARILCIKTAEAADLIYEEFRRKLYCNLVRILIEDAYPDIRSSGISDQLKMLINAAFDQSSSGSPHEFLKASILTPAALIGVGAPTGLFLPEVGRLLGTEVITNEYSPVANALGAIVGNVSASVSMEIRYQHEADTYTVYGLGNRIVCQTLKEAKRHASEIANTEAEKEAIERGADIDTLKFDVQEKENIIDTEFGPLYMGYKITVTASGKLKLHQL